MSASPGKDAEAGNEAGRSSFWRDASNANVHFSAETARKSDRFVRLWIESLVLLVVALVARSAHVTTLAQLVALVVLACTLIAMAVVDVVAGVSLVQAIRRERRRPSTESR